MQRNAPAAEEIVRALADPERLAVAGLVALGPATLGQIAERLQMAPERVRRHLGKLAAAGLVAACSERRTYRLLADELRAAAREAGPRRDPGLALGAVYEDEQRVLRQHFRGGRLLEVPARRSKRLVVLERLALEFDPGVRYDERDVNRILRRFHDDHAALRRYLVDEGFLARDGGRYWRIGGRVEV